MIALDLGLPARLAQVMPRWWNRVVREGGWPTVLAELNDLTERLRSAPPPIDYHLRRIIGDDARLLIRVVATAARETHPRPQVRTTVLVRRFWELFTGGDIRLARPPYGLPDPVHYDHYRCQAQLAEACCPEIYDDAFTLLKDVRGLSTLTGPLTWRPP